MEVRETVTALSIVRHKQVQAEGIVHCKRSHHPFAITYRLAIFTQIYRTYMLDTDARNDV
jgi:hypothetical protein